ncbi:MAG: GFA family protein [Gammaproteobacteria bacterium]
MPALTGHCHCGNIKICFDTELAPEQLPLRACQCSFCRAHGAVATTDPYGKVTLVASDRDAVQHYRFGLGITDMLICKRCGNYVAGIIKSAGKTYATLNANLLDCRAALTATPTPVDYSGETAVQRIARRLASWTPVGSDPGML